ncbi:MAG: SH3 domain-containing protein [Phormidesmis sp.]
MTAPENLTPVLLSNRYQVLNVLGDGGFGKTFLVEDTQMPSNRRCVLKQLKPVHDNPQTGQMVKDRFQREAAILEKLGEAHNQIPRLYAYFSEGGQFYLVEEWVEGDTLTQKVHREGPLPEKTVQNIIAGLLPAVAHVHKEGIVHRDIKPDNIILRAKDSKPVLIDFGAVKETMNTIIDSHPTSSHSIVVGTPGYMPAEQLSGRPVFASDIYAIGMTAIYALTGKLPQELNIDPQTGVLQWRQHATGISTEFANFLDCAIHMNAPSRFPVVQEMQSILNSLILNGMTPPAQPIPQTRQSSETIVSAPPAQAPPAPNADPSENYKTAAVAPGYPYQGIESANTQIVSPQTIEQTGQGSGQVMGANAAMPSSQQQSSGQNSSQNSGQWKNAVIVGGMVGFSVLLGALVVIDKLPNTADNGGNTGTTAVGTANTPGSATDDSATDDTDKEADKPPTSDADDTEADGTTNPATPTPTPTPTSTPTPTQPPVAVVPGANSSIVGQPGSKNIRNGAGTNFEIVDSVQVGDRVKVVARSTDTGGNPWYRVVVPSGNSGWVAGQLIQVDGDAKPPEPLLPPEPVKPTPTPTPPPDSTNGTIVGESGSKNIRSGPGTSYGVAHIAYPGDRVVIRDSSNDSGGFTWYRIYFPESGAEGWIASQLLNID